MRITNLEGWQCERCGHTWRPRHYTSEDEPPQTCPKCKSAYWNQPRQKTRTTQTDPHKD